MSAHTTDTQYVTGGPSRSDETMLRDMEYPDDTEGSSLCAESDKRLTAMGEQGADSAEFQTSRSGSSSTALLQ